MAQQQDHRRQRDVQREHVQDLRRLRRESLETPEQAAEEHEGADLPYDLPCAGLTIRDNTGLTTAKDGFSNSVNEQRVTGELRHPASSELKKRPKRAGRSSASVSF